MGEVHPMGPLKLNYTMAVCIKQFISDHVIFLYFTKVLTAD